MIRREGNSYISCQEKFFTIAVYMYVYVCMFVHVYVIIVGSGGVSVMKYERCKHLPDPGSIAIIN